MGALKKIKNSGVSNVIKHCYRETNNPSNNMIDKTKSHMNYSLIQRNISPYAYYRKRITEVPHVKRKDLVTLCTWCITAPKTLEQNKIHTFFQLTTEFIAKTYGSENIVCSVAHMDETSPHLHAMFIPVSKKSGRICCNDVITRNHLRKFHPLLDQYLKENGLETEIMNGITKKQGGNMEVRKLKLNRSVEYEKKVSYDQITILR